MVLDYVIFGTALGGSIIASAYDLKTTEVPNWVFYVMMIIGIPAVILKLFFSNNFDAFVISGLTGIGLFGFGYMMYRIGQWGGADMVLLALVGFMIPSAELGFPIPTTFPFGISFLFNVFVIGAVYMIFYAIIVSSTVVFTALALYFNSLLSNVLNSFEIINMIILPLVLLMSFFFIYKFAKSVENFGFKKKISISKLRIGDMLMSERKLIGVTQKQINKIKKSGIRTVWIKEGVRFIPVFPLALLFTLFLGDAIMLLQLFF
jgi:Flp pilus assembly protein protease CpaA